MADLLTPDVLHLDGIGIVRVVRFSVQDHHLSYSRIAIVISTSHNLGGKRPVEHVAVQCALVIQLGQTNHLTGSFGFVFILVIRDDNALLAGAANRN